MEMGIKEVFEFTGGLGNIERAFKHSKGKDIYYFEMYMNRDLETLSSNDGMIKFRGIDMNVEITKQGLLLCSDNLACRVLCELRLTEQELANNWQEVKND